MPSYEARARVVLLAAFALGATAGCPRAPGSEAALADAGDGATDPLPDEVGAWAERALAEIDCRVTRKLDTAYYYKCARGRSGVLLLSPLIVQVSKTDAGDRAKLVRDAVFKAIGESAPEVVPRELLRPIIVTRASVDAAWAREDGGMDHAPVLFPLAGNLVVRLVVDQVDRIDYVDAASVRRWNAQPDELYAIALDNLLHATPSALDHTLKASEGVVVTFVDGDAYDAARMLVPGVRASIAAALGGKSVFAIPDRGKLFATRKDNPRALAELRTTAAALFQETTHPLSDQLFEYDEPGGWRTVPR